VSGDTHSGEVWKITASKAKVGPKVYGMTNLKDKRVELQIRSGGQSKNDLLENFNSGKSSFYNRLRWFCVDFLHKIMQEYRIGTKSHEIFIPIPFI
jgi:hypothetical protein